MLHVSMIACVGCVTTVVICVVPSLIVVVVVVVVDDGGTMLQLWGWRVRNDRISAKVVQYGIR